MSVPLAYIGIILIWSTTPLAIKWSGDGPGFLFGVSARMMLSAMIVAVIMSFMSRRLVWHGRALKTYIVAAMGIYGSMLSVYWGAQYIPSGLVSVIFGLTPLTTGLFAAIWLKEDAFSMHKLLGIVLGIAGMSLIFTRGISVGDFPVAAILAVLFAMLLHSFSTVWLKRLQTDVSSIEILYGGLLISIPLYGLTWLLLDEPFPVEFSSRAMLSILYLGIIGSVVGFLMFFYVLKHITASRVGLIPLMTPVLALLLGTQINHEVIPVIVWIGTSCILLGMLIYQWGHRLRRSYVAPDL